MLPQRVARLGLITASPLTRTMLTNQSIKHTLTPITRQFGHGAHHGEEDRSKGPYYGVHLHEPAVWQKRGAQVFGFLLWFWLMYRLKEDGQYLFGMSDMHTNTNRSSNQTIQ